MDEFRRRWTDDTITNLELRISMCEFGEVDPKQIEDAVDLLIANCIKLCNFKIYFGFGFAFIKLELESACECSFSGSNTGDISGKKQ
jgi:hypothetical protein